MIRQAVISDDGVYRYSLTRRWGDGPAILWVMLNPSRADAEVDDPTIRRCIGSSRAWGYGALEVVNLFALRTHDPQVLRAQVDPVGPDNDAHIERAVKRARSVMVAWGVHPWTRDRVRRVHEVIASPCLCLGLTRDGSPRHPLYVRAGAKPITYAGATRQTTSACRELDTRL